MRFLTRPTSTIGKTSTKSIILILYLVNDRMASRHFQYTKVSQGTIVHMPSSLILVGREKPKNTGKLRPPISPRTGLRPLLTIVRVLRLTTSSRQLKDGQRFSYFARKNNCPTGTFLQNSNVPSELCDAVRISTQRLSQPTTFRRVRFGYLLLTSFSLVIRQALGIAGQCPRQTGLRLRPTMFRKRLLFYMYRRYSNLLQGRVLNDRHLNRRLLCAVLRHMLYRRSQYFSTTTTNEAIIPRTFTGVPTNIKLFLLRDALSPDTNLLVTMVAVKFTRYIGNFLAIYYRNGINSRNGPLKLKRDINIVPTIPRRSATIGGPTNKPGLFEVKHRKRPLDAQNFANDNMKFRYERQVPLRINLSRLRPFEEVTLIVRDTESTRSSHRVNRHVGFPAILDSLLRGMPFIPTGGLLGPFPIFVNSHRKELRRPMNVSAITALRSSTKQQFRTIRRKGCVLRHF